ncbi:MAG: Uncharacterised protein [Hyphomonas sp. TMED17]|nr:MAG: Uncharacterised protein [Hyphomonas sp. TMED17]
MAVNAVFGYIQDAILEPFYSKVILLETGVFDSLVRCDPVQSLPVMSPEFL